MSIANGIGVIDVPRERSHYWHGPSEAIAFDTAGIRERLLQVCQPCYVVQNRQGDIGVTNAGDVLVHPTPTSLDLLASTPSIPPEQFGDTSFRRSHGVRYAYAAGAMANGIASEELVIALGQAGMLGSFGAAGLVMARVEQAIEQIHGVLPHGPAAFNLIHSPHEEALERGAVELYLRRGVRTIEAAAFLALTPHVVRYRVSGLVLTPQQQIERRHRIIAKISRREVATQFMEPAPARLLNELLAQGMISEEQARLAQYVPMADDITAEADSGGHTDNRPLVCMLPSIIALRDEIQAHHQYAVPVRVGAAGGISTPASALAAFTMGAAYIVTGSLNQACVESGSSDHTRNLLAQAGMADVMMAPSADMFEMGVKVQLLKKGTLFPMRAQKLYDLYQAYESLDDIPAVERQKLERQVFQKSLDAVWQETVAYFNERDPEQIERAAQKPKRKMALVFRWYLGLSSRWSNNGVKGREMDYQIWCGPAMGAFNDWVRGSYLEEPHRRHAADIAMHILWGAAFLQRVQQLSMQGIAFDPSYRGYLPAAPMRIAQTTLG